MKNIEVVAAAIIKDDKVMITQRGYGAFKDLWEFPGGKIEEIESHKEALIREIKEELKCTIKPIEYLKTIKYQYPDFHLTMHVYISKITKGKPILTEHSALRWVDANELENVSWVPADLELISDLNEYLTNLQ